MNSVLEEDIRQRRKMWSWSNIKEHRKRMKTYREAYVQKLDGKKVSKELQKTLDVIKTHVMIKAENLKKEG